MSDGFHFDIDGLFVRFTATTPCCAVPRSYVIFYIDLLLERH